MAGDEEKPQGKADVADVGAAINRGTPESAAFFLAALQMLEENLKVSVRSRTVGAAARCWGRPH
jgi:hypothetical protein